MDEVHGGPRPERSEGAPKVAEYAQARGFFIDPARVRHPRDKARVENQVPFVRERWFAGESFSDDLALLRAAAETWSRAVAGGRIHGITRRVPRDVFEAEEQPFLLPGRQSRSTCRAGATQRCIPITTCRSPAPCTLCQLGSSARSSALDVDKKTVRLYLQGELIKSHPRMPPGKRATDTSDYPTGEAPYASRSVDALIVRARVLGEHIGVYAERLLAGPLPWIKMRQGYGLVRLGERYGADKVNALCKRSLVFDVIDVPRLERMLKQAPRETCGPRWAAVGRGLGPSWTCDPTAQESLRCLNREPCPSNPTTGLDRPDSRAAHDKAGKSSLPTRHTRSVI